MLLDISAVWCHWCHVMDETSYSDPDVISLINDRFVALRVDNDQRPDVNVEHVRREAVHVQYQRRVGG